MAVRGLMGLKESPLSGEAKGLFTSKVWECVASGEAARVGTIYAHGAAWTVAVGGCILV
jgi:hypothetical protein